MIVDGKKIAEEIINELGQMRNQFPPKLCLGVLMGEGDAASASFVKIKERVAERLQVVVIRELVSEHTNDEQAVRALARLVESCAGVIIQMPLPPQIDLDAIVDALPPEKDIDAITHGKNPPVGGVRAPVAEAVSEVFVRHGISAHGKEAVVVGAGKLVGAPVADLLRELGAHVSVITQNEGSLTNLKKADIVVLGAGEPGLVTPEMLKEGVVLIDAGTSGAPASLVTAISGIPPKAVTGDADPRCAEVASVFTPVPGGIGPIAVAMLFKNLFVLARQK